MMQDKPQHEEQLLLLSNINWISISLALPGGKDPDEARREDEEAFCNAIASSKTSDGCSLIRSFLHRDAKNIEDKKKILDELLPVFGAFVREVERALFYTSCAKLGVSQGVVAEEWRHASRFSTPPVPKRHNPRSAFLPDTFEYLLGLFLLCHSISRRKSFISDRPSSWGKRKNNLQLLQEQYTREPWMFFVLFWELLPQKDAGSSIGFLLFCRREGSTFFQRGYSAERVRKMIRKMNQELITKKFGNSVLLFRKPARRFVCYSLADERTHENAPYPSSLLKPFPWQKERHLYPATNWRRAQ